MLYKARLILPKRVKDEMECMLITAEGNTIRLIATVESMGDSNLWHLEEVRNYSINKAKRSNRNGNTMADYPFAKLWRGQLDITTDFCGRLHKYIVTDKLTFGEASQRCNISQSSLSTIVRKQPKVILTSTALAIRTKLWDETEEEVIQAYKDNRLGDA